MIAAVMTLILRRPGGLAVHLVALVLVCVLPLVGLALIALLRLADARRDFERQEITGTARALGSVIDLRLGDAIATLEALATSPSLAIGDIGVFYDQCRSIAEHRHAPIILADRDGQEIFSTVVAYGTPLPHLLNGSAVEQALAARTPQISGMFFGRLSRTLSVTVVIPVIRLDRPMQVLLMSIPLATLTDILTAQHLPESWTATLVDRNDTILARSRAADSFVGKRVQPEVSAELAKGTETAFAMTTLDGARATAAAVRSPIAGWAIVVAVSVADIEGPVWRSQVWLVAGGGLAALVGCLLALLIGRRITGTMARLSHAALALGRRESLPSPAAPFREAAELADALHKADALLQDSQARLEQARKMEAIGRLTGGVAHDFNNLLTVVRSNAETLASELQGEQREMAGLCLLAAQRGAELSSRLLAFARRQVLQPTSIDVNDLVMTVVELMHRSLGPGIAIEARLGEGLPDAIADRALLESALINLAINARDAMPGGGRVTIETATAVLDATYADANGGVRPGTYVVIAVTDNGTGMTNEVLARAFEPFFTTKPMGRGTGLGLSVIYGFARQSGGHCKIHRALGRGTMVELYLPVAPGSEASGAGAPPHLLSQTILIVENDALDRARLARQIRGLGYRVVEAVSAEQAIAMLRGTPVDLVLSHVTDPGGMSAAKLATQAAALRPGTRMLIADRAPEHAPAQQAAPNAAVALASKPHELKQLAEQIRAALGGRE